MGGNQLAERYRPSTWKDFIGDNNLVDTLRFYIEKDQPLSIMLEGPSGTGKTSLANLWTKSLLCREREQNSSEPCGYCPVCKGEDTLNITNITIEDASKAKEGLERILIDAKTPPRIVKNNSGVSRQVIIINELQNASNAYHAGLLDAIETSPPFTTWILVTMSPEKFHPTTLEALRGRCFHVKLSRKTDIEISNHLSACFPLLKKDVCEAIAFFSNGNVRESWGILSLIYPRFDIEDISSDLIYEYKGGGCNNEERSLLWKSIDNGDLNTIKSLVCKWTSKASEDVISTLLVKDLTNNLNINDDKSFIKLVNLQQWCRLSIKVYPLLTCLLSMSCELNRSSTLQTTVVDDIYNQLKDKISLNMTPLEFKKEVNNVSSKGIPLTNIRELNALFSYYGV